MLKRIPQFVLLVGLLALGCQQETQAPRQADPKVQEVLAEMSQFLHSTPAVRFRERAVFDEALPDGDQTVEVSRTADILIVRPDRLSLSVDADDGTK